MAALELELRTRHLPALRLSEEDLAGAGGSSSSGGLGGWFFRWLRPRIVLRTPFGAVDKAPYGDPGESTWPLLAVVAIALVGALLVLLGLGVASLVRR